MCLQVFLTLILLISTKWASKGLKEGAKKGGDNKAHFKFSQITIAIFLI